MSRGPRRLGGLVALTTALLMGACGFYVSDNVKLEDSGAVPAPFDPGRVAVFLALSGGGTRAAALAYGAMKALEEIAVPGEDGRPSTLLREVDYISSVSGGSFTAAFYAHTAGEPARGRFDEIVGRVLHRNLELEIGVRLFANPLNWFRIPFTAYDRTQVAASLYGATIFDGARLGDLPPRPRLILNASDLVTGLRFEFSPAAFRCLGSDYARYPLGHAVAASSAFPGAFTSITLTNHGGDARACLTERDRTALTPATREVNPVRTARAERRLQYLDRRQAGHVHLSDGGITDNLGLDAFLDLLSADGELGRRINQRRLKAVAVISVNATPAAPVKIGRSGGGPSVLDVVVRAFDLYLWDAGAETVNDLSRTLEQKADFARVTGRDLRLFFIEVKLDDITDPARRLDLASIGTRLALPREQVNALGAAGRELLLTGRNGRNRAELDGLVEVFRSLPR